MATVTHYPGVNGETGRIDLHTPSQGIAIDYSPAKILITRAGREFELHLPPLPILRSTQELAEADSAIKTAALWAMISVALISISAVGFEFSKKILSDTFLRILNFRASSC